MLGIGCGERHDVELNFWVMHEGADGLVNSFDTILCNRDFRTCVLCYLQPELSVGSHDLVH